MKKIAFLFGMTALLAACSSTPANLGTPELVDVGTNQAVAGQVIVKYRAGASTAGLQALSSTRASSTWGTLALVSVQRGRELETARDLASRPEIEYAEPNYWISSAGRFESSGLGIAKVGGVRTAAVPGTITDPYFANVVPGNAFDLTTPVGTVYTNETYNWHIKRVRAPEAWAAGATGAGVVIAGIDEGIDLTHPDLKDNIWVNPNPANPDCPGTNGYDFADDDADPTDTGGHGTHTAGTFAAAANGIGVVGVAPEAKIMAIRALTYVGGSTYMLVRGLKYAADCGANVANNSWGGSTRSKAFGDVLRYGTAKGTVYVFSSGNSFRDANRPSDPVGFSTEIAGVIGVGATSNDNRRVGFSSSGRYVTVVAPGEAIMSTVPVGQGNPSDAYAFLQGTSMAAPHVTGVVALVFQAYKDAHAGKNPTPEQVRVTLEQTANATLTGQGLKPDYTNNGQYGYGLVDAKAAIDFAKTLP